MARSEWKAFFRQDWRFESGQHKPGFKNNKSGNQKMKATDKNIGRLVVGFILACALTSNLLAQSTATNGPNTGLTAAQQAAAEAAQLQALMQATAQALAQAQAAHPARTASAAGQNAGQQSLIVGGQSEFSEDYAPWVLQDIPMSNGSQLTADALLVQSQNELLIMSTNIAALQAEQQAAVSNLLLGQTIQIPQAWTNVDGSLLFFDHINADGSPAIKMTYNLESARTVGAQKLWPGGSSGFSITGSNVLLAEWDGGDVRTNHQEFTNGFRVSLIDGPTAYGVADHSTHVAGTMTAYGVNGTAIGFANRALLEEGYYRNDVTEMPIQAATKYVRESNHSYGYTAGWSGLINVSGTNYYFWAGNSTNTGQSWIFGFYDGPGAATNDSIIYKAQTYLPVVAAGNANGYPAPASQPVKHVELINGVYYFTTFVHPANGTNGFNTLTAYACSKNDLVVGAVNPNTNGYSGTNTTAIGYFSSLGPTADGRIKPDVVADGVNVFSTVAESTSAYTNMTGTSMAAPAVTGSLGLLTSLYQELYSTNAPLLSSSNAPLASTLRGLLIHTADQLGTNIGPSYTYGWGLIDPVAAATLITTNYASHSVAFIKEVRLNNGDFIQFPVVLTNNKPFKATITWSDPPGTPTPWALNPTNHMLVNDLDLRVIAPSGTTNFPWVLNPNLPANVATTGDNNLDNVEQVSIPNPTSGTYIVRVTNKGTLVDDLGQTNSQALSILLSGNIAQPPTLPKIASLNAYTVSNTVAVKWATDVGRVYRVQANSNLKTTNWLYSTGELSATKTNTAVVLPIVSATNQFYRVVQVR